MATEPSELLSKQLRFPMQMALFIAKVYELGYVISCGDGERNPKVFGRLGESKGYGAAKSCHKLRLAHDWHLYKWIGEQKPVHRGDGTFDYSHAVGQWEYCELTEDHAELGKFWKSLNADNCWGGDFRSPDGNHYSIEYGGMK